MNWTLAIWSVFAGICVSLFVLCELQITAPAEAYSATHSAGFRYIPVILGGCGILFARHLLGWKNRLISALVLTILMTLLCSVAFISAGLIQEILRLTRLSHVIFITLHGEDVSHLPHYLLSALAGLSMSIYSFFASSSIRHWTSRPAD